MAAPRRPRLRAGGVQLAVAVVAVASGGVARLLGATGVADVFWALITLEALVPAGVVVVRDLIRHRAGVDVVAVLALAGSLAVGEPLAGAVIALMLSTGRALEARAVVRARCELTALLEHAPSVVHRVEGDRVTTPPLDGIRPGDVLIVASGEVVPVDGKVVEETALLDESALSGETRLVERTVGESVRSGGVNAAGPFRLLATSPAAESTYAGIVQLVRQAEVSRAPLVRVADRFAVLFVPLTVLTAGLAALLTRDPVRAVAVLVVATPCPLILAAPVALVAGMSRAAQRGVVVKNGGAFEALGRADTLLFDKTGTLTAGRAHVAGVETNEGVDADELLRLAASLDQVSSHALSAPIVRAAADRGLRLALPTGVTEEPGRGVRGLVGGRRVSVGRVGYVAPAVAAPDWARRLRRRTAYEGMANVFVAVDDTLAGALVLEDPIRPDAARTLQRLRRAGIRRLVMVTGDHPDVAAPVAEALGVDAVEAERTPAEKVEVVTAERAGGVVVMVGDGINDAPALAAADVGVAMGSRGATASSEAADVVMVVDRLDRLADALVVARRSHRIAVESIVAGMGMSFAAMAVAALGGLAPVVGAVLQEGIDIAVILNALRALRGGPLDRRPTAEAVELGRHVLAEHGALRRGTTRIREVADRLGEIEPVEARAEVESIRRFLDDEVLPHERDEEERFYPTAADFLGGEPTVVIIRREHAEIARLARLLGRMLDDLGPAGPGNEDLADPRRVLYGLDALLRLHRAEEEEEHLARVVDEPTLAMPPPDRVHAGAAAPR